MNPETKIENATIRDTHFGPNDSRNIMTFMLTLTFGDSTEQGFGNYNLTTTPCVKIKNLLEVVGVNKWEDLKGKIIRTKTETRQIVAIGNLLKDKWFNIEDELN